MNKLPETKESQSWCCINGCGECTPLLIDYEYSREEDKYGNLIESKTEKEWVSSCCKIELLLWDEDKQDFIDFEYVKDNE